MKIIPGRIQELPVFELSGRQVWLGDEHHKVAIDRREINASAQPGDLFTVFVYFNDQREPEATRRLPSIETGGLGLFRIINSGDLGAFIDIGSKRDILIPKREQRLPLEAGRMVLVTLQYDAANHRLFGSTRFTEHFPNIHIPFERGEAVDLIIAEKLDIGRRVIVNGTHTGVLFTQEMMRTYREGEQVKGFIRKVEGKEITVSTQKEGEELVMEAAERLLEVLNNNKGYLRLNDDSDPEEIKLRLRMSKKTFKKAVGHLYKTRKVELTRFGVKLVAPETPKPPKPPERIKHIRKRNG